jgi:hypothetical protein
MIWVTSNPHDNARSARRHMAKVANYSMLLLPIAVSAMVASPSLANSAFAINYASNYPITETSSTGYASLIDPSTGISVTLSHANSNASFGILAKRLTGPTNGERTANMVSPEYYGMTLLGITSGNAKICVPYVNSNSNAMMQYSVGGNWSTFSDISTGNNMICGQVSVIPFTSNIWTNSYTDISVGVRS